ncbi:MAG: 50S ribosomal protein L25 [Patescibacteria group bacterium]|nr:MAG: 50S ribosomal protein L25 [Patescibacteria group bacterium]
MSEAIVLSAELRKERVTDKKDFIPAVVYGSGMENTSLVLKRNDFEKVFAQSGESGLLSLQIEGGKTVPVIVKDFQADPVKHRIMHVDFFMVNMKEKVIAEVNLDFVGEAPAAKTYGGIVIKSRDTVEIECLPNDLMQKMEVDLSVLENLGDAIYLKDLKLPDGVNIIGEAEEVIANVVEPRKIVETAEVTETTTSEKEEKEEGDKKEEETKE